jgi:hypothetical protein
MTDQTTAKRIAELRGKYAACTANHPDDDRCEWMRHDYEALMDAITDQTTKRHHYEDHARELDTMHAQWERKLRHCNEDPTCDKGEKTDLESIVHDMRKHLNAYRKALGMVAASLALLFCTLSPASAQPAAPAGCTIAGTTGEGFPVATCQDGTVWYADMDGQTHPAAPYVAPGTWVSMSDASPVFP